MKPVALSLLAWIAFGACVGAQQPPARGQRPAGPPATATEAWLECVECSTGELQAVTKLGQAAVPELSSALVDGPPAAKRQSYDKYLRKMFADLKAYEKTHPKSVVASTEDEFVTRDMAKYTNLYRVRAARALGEIGGPNAIDALDRALKLQLDPYVRTKVTEARSKLK